MCVCVCVCVPARILDLSHRLPMCVSGNLCLQDKGTALYAAVVKGHRSCVARLIEAKANVNIPNHKRVTPLMTTKVLGHDGLTHLLESADAKSWVAFSDR